MAPRKQTKAAGSVVADANGDASPPRKRKIAPATKPVAEETKQPRTGLRRGKAQKVEVNDNDAVAMDASPPKKARSGKGKTAATETKGGKSNKVAKAEEAMNNNAEEKAPKQTAEKKARATKTAGAMTKKAGTKEQPAAKSKAVKKTRNNTAATENGADGDTAEVADVAAPAKRTRGKVMEKENAMPATRTAKAPKKRKTAEEKAAGDAEVAEEELTVPDKKPRGKPKKAAGVQAANEQVKSKGKAKKNTAKAEAATSSSKEIEEEEQNAQDTAEQEDSAKIESTRNTKKGNARKAAPKTKRNAVVMERDDDTPMEDAVETDIQENGKVDNAQSKKKRNTGKTNTTTKDKTEAKGRQKKGQATTTVAAAAVAAAATVDEKEFSKDAENDAAEKVNTASSEAQDESYTNEVAQNDEIPYKKEIKGEADKVELPESVESAHPIDNETLKNEANTSTDKDEN